MKFILIAMTLSSLCAHAKILTPSSANKINVKVEYTFGSHLIEHANITGEVELDEATQQINRGKLEVSVLEFSRKNQELLCHLQESLGLDYEKSGFPESHVCVDNKLPSEGPNSIVYPTIQAKLSQPLKLGDQTVDVSWTIHGVTKTLQTPVKLSFNEESKTYNLRGKMNFNLSDFSIVVKKFLFIGVKDQIPVSFSFELGDKK
jgi:polyisoprenoid-binding protein YceI